MGLKDLFKKRGDKNDSGEPPELRGLIAKLDDTDWKVRFDACQGIAAFGRRARSATPRLHELINDDNGDVCNAAAAALSEIERESP